MMRIGNDENWLHTIYKILDMYFISIKNMKWTFGMMYQISFENIKKIETKKPETKNQETLHRFYFRVKESPVPLNIPTQTPAPDRGGPVA